MLSWEGAAAIFITPQAYKYAGITIQLWGGGGGPFIEQYRISQMNNNFFFIETTGDLNCPSLFYTILVC